jgi:hypothetical protein
MDEIKKNNQNIQKEITIKEDKNIYKKLNFWIAFFITFEIVGFILIKFFLPHQVLNVFITVLFAPFILIIFPVLIAVLVVIKLVSFGRNKFKAWVAVLIASVIAEIMTIYNFPKFSCDMFIGKDDCRITMLLALLMLIIFPLLIIVSSAAMLANHKKNN